MHCRSGLADPSVLATVERMRCAGASVSSVTLVFQKLSDLVRGQSRFRRSLWVVKVGNHRDGQSTGNSPFKEALATVQHIRMGKSWLVDSVGSASNDWWRHGRGENPTISAATADYSRCQAAQDDIQVADEQ
jgi:hypothetical protein